MGGFVKPKAVVLDDEEEEDDDVDGQLQKWDEGEVKVDQDDELAIRMFMKPPSKVDDNFKGFLVSAVIDINFHNGRHERLRT